MKNIDNNYVGKHLDSIGQEHLKAVHRSKKFNIHLLTSLHPMQRRWMINYLNYTTKTSAEILLDINKHVFISVKLLLEHKHTSTIHTEDTNDCFGIIVDKSSPLLDGDDVAVCILNLIIDHSYATSNLSSAKFLVHIRAFVKEVLRLSLVSPVIILSTKESTKFDVTRWLGENASVIPPHTYSPFGIGPRACIAEKYLFNLLSGILAVLLYHNNFEKVDSISEPQEGTFGLANLPPNFSLTATPLSARS
ncbi:unnamed protein product [Rotaria magnacalcarata]|uniref:Cytochrome P450 n=1 Tax=Rotaria magnacalcarata TaxID=392030 RepID=A0A816TIE3_9BILA|nr:unnamed protein product [Rotaria magnacalcarata]